MEPPSAATATAWRRSAGRRLAVLLLLLLAPGLAREDSDAGEHKGFEFAPPLQLNRPTWLHGLVLPKLQCHGVALPAYHHAWVSLMGIVGFPQVTVAPTPAEAVESQKQAQKLGLKNLAGWQVLGMPGGTQDNFTFLCFNTASRQAGEASLIVAIQNQTSTGNETAGRVPPIELAPGYTSMWLLEEQPKGGDEAAAASSLCFLLPVDPTGDVVVSVGPMDGEADLEVYDGAEGCGAGDLLATSRLVGPDVVELAPLAHGFGPVLHIRVTGSGRTALTAGPRDPGPLLAAGVPVAGRLTPRPDGSPACNKARLVASGTNFTVVATSEGGAALRLRAAFLKQPPSGAWQAQRLPGVGHDEALLIQAPAEPSEEAVVVSLTVCLDLGSSLAPAHEALYWLTATPDAAETTLLDGQPWSVPRPRDLNWHLYRFRVSCGGHMLVTLSVDSPESVELMADFGTAAVHEQNCSSFRWGAEGQGSQRAFMQLTSDPKLETGQVHLIKSKCPSYVYAAVRNVESASAVEEGKDLWWRILATSSQGEKVLLEAKDVEESLGEGGVQIFRYNVEDADSAVMFSITAPPGEVVFDISARSDFPDERNLTIKGSHVVALLPPAAGPCRAARELARAEGRSPVLYMRVRSTSQGPSSFTVAARKHDDLQEITPGEPQSGAVKLFGYDRYYFRISSENLQDRLIVDVTKAFLDPPTLFIGCDGNRYPQEGSADWFLRVNDSSGGSIVLDPSSHHCHEGDFYIAITSTNRSAYTMQVDLMVDLQDGVEQPGQVNPDHRSIHTLLPRGGEPQYSPLSIRAQAVTGSLGFCVLEPEAIFRRLPGTVEDCERLGIFAKNLTAAGGGEDALAAVDLPSRLPQIALLVFGLAAEGSSFYVGVQSGYGAPLALAKGRAAVADALVAPCCRGNVTPPAYAVRRYRYPVPPADSASSVLLLELNGLGGSQLRDVLLQAREADGPLEAPYSSDRRSPTAGLPVRLMVDTSRFSRKEGGELRPLEILVNATWQQASFFSLKITQFEQERRLQLLPNTTVRNDFGSMLSVDELSLPNGSASDALQLRLEQCSGELRAEVWGVAGLREGLDLDMALPQSARALLVAPASVKSSYEVELRSSPAGPREEEILLPDPPILIPRWYRGSISFVFGAAAAAGAAGVGGTESAQSLRYTLVAARKNGSASFHLNASCGVAEALQAGLLFTTEQASKPGSLRGDQLEVPLPRPAVELFDQEESLWVNVLVTLQAGADTAAAPVARRSYALFDLDPKRKDLRLDARRPDASGFFGAIAIFIAFCACWSTVSRCNWCGRSAAPDQMSKDRDVELEVQYDLHHEVAMDLLPARSSYVPPTM